MMKEIRRLFIFTIPLIAGFLFFTSSVALAVTVGPPKLEISSDPGKTYKGKIFLMNEENERRTFYPSFEKFIEVNGEKKFLSSESTELTNWFKMPESVTLEPQEQNFINYEIEIPENASPGGHFAIIWWSTAPKNEGGSSILTRAGIVVYLRVSGQVVEDAVISSFDTGSKGRFLSKLPNYFYLVFKNIGNVHVKPQGNIVVKNIFGRSIISLPVNSSGLEVLPESERTFQPSDTTGKGRLAFGLYSVNAQINYGDDNKKLSSRLFIFVFPWKLISILIVSLAAVAVGLTKGIKKYNQWIIAKATPVSLPISDKSAKIKREKKSEK